jgi:hypothetical protein
LVTPHIGKNAALGAIYRCRQQQASVIATAATITCGFRVYQKNHLETRFAGSMKSNAYEVAFSVANNSRFVSQTVRHSDRPHTEKIFL